MTPRFAALLLLVSVAMVAQAAAGEMPSQAGDLRVPHPPKPVGLRFSILKTSVAHPFEGMIVSQGEAFKPVAVNYSAVVVQHPQGTFLLDTGLGRRIDRQYGQDMAWWAKPFFAYGKVAPARDQLDAAGLPPIPRIFLTHAHWDHASGVTDFPEANVWVNAPERSFVAGHRSTAVFPSQFPDQQVRWHSYELNSKRFAGYERSLDIYGDGSAVLVGLPGHTPGSVGLFLSPASGRQYFFCGDVVWSLAAVRRQRPKFWVASLLVDDDAAATLLEIQRLNALMAANPDLTVVPAHDAAVQDALGYFPGWRQ